MSNYFSNSHINSQRTNSPGFLTFLNKKTQFSIADKYQTTNDAFNKHVVNNLIFNETSKVVAQFKDFLIFEDSSEFLKRMYSNEEVGQRLQKICEFYENYSKIFPNYTVFYESKYIYKNIRRKQKLIDKNQENPDNDEHKDTKIFHTETYNSLCMNKTKRTVTELSFISFENIISSIEKAEKDISQVPQINKQLNIMYSTNTEKVQILISPEKGKSINVKINSKKQENEEKKKMKKSLMKENTLSTKIPKFKEEKSKILHFQKAQTKSERTGDFVSSPINLLDQEKLKRTISPASEKSTNLIFPFFQKIDKTSNTVKNSKEKIQENSNITKTQDNQTLIKKNTLKKINVNVVKIDLNKENFNHKPTISMPKLNLKNIYRNYNDDKKYNTDRSKSIKSIVKENIKEVNLISETTSNNKVSSEKIMNGYEKLRTEINAGNSIHNQPILSNILTTNQVEENDLLSNNQVVSPVKKEGKRKKWSENSGKKTISKVTEFFKNFKTKTDSASKNTNGPMTSRNLPNLYNGSELMSERMILKNTSIKNLN
jgi:hypothetical protein